MFYVWIFALLGVLLVFAFAATRSRRRKERAADEGHVAPSGGHPGTHHGAHDDAGRRTTKAKRAQSRHDRRKRR